jgi:hypothetical protein
MSAFHAAKPSKRYGVWVLVRVLRLNRQIARNCIDKVRRHLVNVGLAGS